MARKTPARDAADPPFRPVLDQHADELGFNPHALPRPIYLLLENLFARDPRAQRFLPQFEAWLETRQPGEEIPFRPSRILMQDTAGVAALADLAALRDWVAEQGGAPETVDSAVPIDLVVDHSVVMDRTASPDALAYNTGLEFERNAERFAFFKWAQNAFANLRVIPPGNGICHQINLERLTGIATALADRPGLLAGESVIGTDSHTTMVNALGVLGWGVGGMEAEIVALGEALMMQIPCATAVRFVGRRATGITATDIALAVTHRLRAAGVVGHFVEFMGEGLDALTLADRAAISNMCPEYGASCGLFPVDHATLDYLAATGRSPGQLAMFEAYARASRLWRDDGDARRYTQTLTIDLGDIVPQMAGPRRPQDTVPLAGVPGSLRAGWPALPATPDFSRCGPGAVAIASITSCTNTANPHLMIAAGLLARNARRRGLMSRSWVKTSLAPGSRRIADLLARSGLQDDLDALGFHVAGFGCATCVGNSGDIAPKTLAVASEDFPICAVLSGNRNFEGRIHPDVKANYLASPPLVIASALAGNLLIDLANDPLGEDEDGAPVYLEDIWPDDGEIAALHDAASAGGGEGPPEAEGLWERLAAPTGARFSWDDRSTHVRQPPFFQIEPADRLVDIAGARPLLVLGDSITTDHISPIGRILPGTPAARHLEEAGVAPPDWGSYGERRANHDVMWRGTFAHPRLRNALAPGAGPMTTTDSGETTDIFTAALAYQRRGVAALVFAGREYGTGSARDWAAKGTGLMGVRAVVAQSFERIHRANLVGAGVLPIEVDEAPDALNLTPKSEVSITGLSAMHAPRGRVRIRIVTGSGPPRILDGVCRLDTETEIAWLRCGGMFGFSRRGQQERIERRPPRPHPA